MNYSLRAYSIGEQDLPGWCCLFGKNDTSLHRIVFHVWIAQADGKTIIIDTGFPPDAGDLQTLTNACEKLDPACALRTLSTLDQVFDKSGITPDSVDAVLITQPITYHTGGLLPRYFPRAKVYISRAGLWEFLLDNPGHPPRDCYFTEKAWQFLRQVAIEDRLCLPDQHTEVFDGLFIEPTGGHHPGSAAVMLQTSKGLIGILETAFLDVNITQEHPIGLAEDAAQTRRVIREYKRRCNPVLAIHDNGILERFPGGVIT